MNVSGLLKSQKLRKRYKTAGQSGQEGTTISCDFESTVLLPWPRSAEFLFEAARITLLTDFTLEG